MTDRFIAYFKSVITGTCSEWNDIIPFNWKHPMTSCVELLVMYWSLDARF